MCTIFSFNFQISCSVPAIDHFWHSKYPLRPCVYAFYSDLFGLIHVVDIFVGGDYHTHGNMYSFCILSTTHSPIYVSPVKVSNNPTIHGGRINITSRTIILIKNCHPFLDFRQSCLCRCIVASPVFDNLFVMMASFSFSQHC